ncbi:hypothetical protein F5884DRAFT_833292 [Xylogone sp. PMI_703]|nr:hypothetical protein F5884DRAFT_833292 [Xylogone sp. PMI_703]
MPNTREVKTCHRCRQLKLRCDRTKPSCNRCTGANASCSFATPLSTPTSITKITSDNYTLSNIEYLPPPTSADEHSMYLERQGDVGAVKEPSIIKRRNRAHLSCIRCYRLKVKCDKGLPCSRCRISGWGEYCAYHHRIESNTPSSDTHSSQAFIVKEDPGNIATSWHAQRRGATHWSNVLSKLKLQAECADIPACHIVSEVIQRWRSMETTGDAVLPSNFPFNSPEAGKYISLGKVLDLLQSHREKNQIYIHEYLALYQPIYPIIDIPQFSNMVDKFWNDPKSIDISWLASFLMVLALGCFAVSRDPSLTAQFCMAAEACLSKTPFMVQPDISAMRTLCLMIVAKQIINTTCRAFDSCWTLLGIVTRVAIGMGLNKQPQLQTQTVEASYEWQSGHALWILIVYFCIQVAAITGKPPLVSIDDIGLEHWSPSCNLKMTDPWTVFLEAYPTICHIIRRVNSDGNKPSYDEVLEYNDQVRQLMDLLDNTNGKSPLYITLSIFFRRILLVLHRSYALNPSAPVQFSASYWSSLECSLAILVDYRDMCEYKDSHPSNIELLGRFFKLDFFSSLLTVGLHLLRRNAPLAAGFAIPPRQTIMDTMQACIEIWGRETHNSMCFEIGYKLLTSILKALPDVDRNGFSNYQP